MSVVITIVQRESEATIRQEERDWRELVRAGKLIRRKALDSTFSRRTVCVEPPQICEAYSIQGRTTSLYRASNWGGVKKTTKAPQNTQPLRSLFREKGNVIFPRKITRKRKT